MRPTPGPPYAAATEAACTQSRGSDPGLAPTGGKSPVGPRGRLTPAPRAPVGDHFRPAARPEPVPRHQQAAPAALFDARPVDATHRAPVPRPRRPLQRL